MTTAEMLDVVRVQTPARGLAHNVRAVRVVWQREMIRFSRDRFNRGG